MSSSFCSIVYHNIIIVGIINNNNNINKKKSFYLFIINFLNFITCCVYVMYDDIININRNCGKLIESHQLPCYFYINLITFF